MIRITKYWVCLLIPVLLYLSGCSGSRKAQVKGAMSSVYLGESSRDAYTVDEISAESEKERLENKISTKKERMVVYSSDFRINVEDIKAAMAFSKKLAEDLGGYIETSGTSDSYQKARIVLRIPVQNFSRAVSEIEKIGVIESRNISAEDVTEKYTDMKLREESLQHIRERLYSLLKRTKKSQEKVKILKEISRITAEIESLNASMEYYRNRSSYSTIVLNLSAYMKQNSIRYIPSPFQWIRDLDVNNVSVKKDRLFFGKFSYEVPDGYFNRYEIFRKGESNYIFVTPGYTSGIRFGSVENYPVADDIFWKEALVLDSKNRFYEIIEQDAFQNKNSYKYTVTVFRIPDGSVYIVAFRVYGEKIAVCEAFYNNEEKYAELKEKFKSFLENLEFK